MAKTWVLDTETKGTGAHIAPLSPRAKQGEREKQLALVQLERGPRPAPAPEEQKSTRFRVVDVMSGAIVGEELDARSAVAALEQMRSALDARVYVRASPGGRWRLLSLGDTRRMWELARARAG